MTLNNYFDKIYCLNLASRTDRWAECLPVFNKYKLDVTRFEAVDGKTLNKQSNTLNPGEMAIIFSIIRIFADVKKNGYSSILILEDDIDFVFNPDELKQYMDAVPGGWDMLYFGGNHMSEKNIERVNNRVIKINNTLTSHCIGFRNENNLFDTISYTINKLEKQLDCYYMDLQKVFNSYSFNPGIATQRPSHSDIQNLHTDYRFIMNKIY